MERIRSRFPSPAPIREESWFLATMATNGANGWIQAASGSRIGSACLIRATHIFQAYAKYQRHQHV